MKEIGVGHTSRKWQLYVLIQVLQIPESDLWLVRRPDLETQGESQRKQTERKRIKYARRKWRVLCKMNSSFSGPPNSGGQRTKGSQPKALSTIKGRTLIQRKNGVFGRREHALLPWRFTVPHRSSEDGSLPPVLGKNSGKPEWGFCWHLMVRGSSGQSCIAQRAWWLPAGEWLVSMLFLWTPWTTLHT